MSYFHASNDTIIILANEGMMYVCTLYTFIFLGWYYDDTIDLHAFKHC